MTKGLGLFLWVLLLNIPPREVLIVPALLFTLLPDLIGFLMEVWPEGPLLVYDGLGVKLVAVLSRAF